MKISKKTKIFWPGAGWLPEHYLMAMPNQLKKMGYDVTVDYDWLAPNNEIQHYEGYDLIICHGPSVIRPFVSGHNIDKKTPPQIHHVWDYPIFRRWDGYGFCFIISEFESIKKRAWKVITMSKTTKQLLKQEYDIDSDVQLSYFDNQMVDSVPEQKRENQILMASFHRPEKNVQLLIQALYYFEKKPKLVLTGGGGGCEEIVTDMAKAFGIEITKKYDLPYEDVIKEIKKSKVLVHPSAFEGFGLSPKEAAWSKTPIILGDIPVMREYHGEHMNYVSLVDPKALAHYLTLVFERGEVGYDLEEQKKLMEPLTIENQAIKFVKYLEKLDLP
jgi:glycosyltransferase involved in cell wall biosynthesis